MARTSDPHGSAWVQFLRARLSEDPQRAYLGALLDRYEELVASGKEQGHVEGGDAGEEYRYVVFPVLALPYADHPDYPASDVIRP
jgi:hypothetical protein